jgi:hypothetical protein
MVCSANAQWFVDASNESGVVQFNSSPNTQGQGVSFCDVDNDGFDDITMATSQDSIVFFHNLGNGTFQRREIIPNTGNAKSVCWVDYDNDGDKDLMLCRTAPSSRFYRNDGNFQFTDITSALNLPALSGVQIYGQAWGDYNRDGWLDVYFAVKSITTTNFLCRNNGDGTFTQVAFSAGVDNGNLPSFQGCWIDINQDHWPDLYVINDLNNPNALYINNGDGTFTDQTATSNLAINAQSMSNSFCDYDRDGDWDLYVVDVPTGNFLMQNDGSNFFTNVATQANVLLNSYCWGATWIDIDHDRNEDLFVATAYAPDNRDFLLRNLGDGTFQNTMEPIFDTAHDNSFSHAKGDYNNDGWYDLIISKQTGGKYTFAQGTPGSNHWIKVTLQGTHSNKDAVGSFIELWSAGQRTIFYTRSGDNYLSQDSQHLILSLGEQIVADSIAIIWSRGLREVYTSLPADSSYLFVEGASVTNPIEAFVGTAICPGDSTELNIQGTWINIVWENGMNTASRIIHQAGVYSVELTNALGYVFNFDITIDSLSFPVYTLQSQAVSCFGESNGQAQIIFDGPAGIAHWPDSISSLSRNDLEAGIYSIEIVSEDGCSTTDQVTIDTPEILSLTLSSTNPLCHGDNNGTITTQIAGGTSPYNIDFGIIDPMQVAAGNWAVYATDANGCDTVETIQLIDPPSIVVSESTINAVGIQSGSATIEATGGTGVLSIAWNDGNMNWTRNDLAQGIYFYTITDQNQCTYSDSISVINTSVVELAESNFMLWPNPAHDRLELSILNNGPIQELNMYDVTGRKCVYTQPFLSKVEINTTNLSRGIYFIHLQTEKGTFSTRIELQ